MHQTFGMKVNTYELNGRGGHTTGNEAKQNYSN